MDPQKNDFTETLLSDKKRRDLWAQTSQVSVTGAGIAGAGDPPGMGLLMPGKTSEVSLPIRSFVRKMVKSVRQVWIYPAEETHGVSKESLSGEQHDRYEITVGNEKPSI